MTDSSFRFPLLAAALLAAFGVARPRG